MGELDSVLGTLLIGTWGASGLFTLELVWSWRYYHSFPKDAISLKLLVFGAMLFDFVALAAACASNYLYCITHWGDEVYLQNQYWPVPIYIISTAFTAAIVQGFLIYRFIQLAGRNWCIVGVLILLVVACFVSSLVTAGMVITYRALDQRILLKAPINIWFTTDAGADVAIALALAWQLYRRRRSGAHRTNTLLCRLAAMSLQSGSITAMFALATLIAYLVNPESNVSTIFEWRLWPSSRRRSGENSQENSVVTIGRGPIRFIHSDHIDSSDDYGMSTSQAISTTIVPEDTYPNSGSSFSTAAEQESGTQNVTSSSNEKI